MGSNPTRDARHHPNGAQEGAETMLYKAVADLSAGDTILTRSERGKLISADVVQGTGPCRTDASMRHVVVRNRKSGDITTWCCYSPMRYEIKGVAKR